MPAMQPVLTANPVSRSVPPVLPTAKEDSNLVMTIAVPILQALGLLLVLGGIGFFVAALQIPATVCLVTGLAALILGFAIERLSSASSIAPTFDSIPLSEALLAAIQKIPAVPPLDAASIHEHLSGATLGQGVGDAIGLATEFKSKQYAKDNFHDKELEFGHEAFTKGMAHAFPAGAVTDDTEQATAIIRAITEHQLNPEKCLAISFAEQMKHWAKNGLDSFHGKYATNESVKLTSARDIGMLTGEVLSRSDFLSTPQAAAHSVWLQTKNKASNGSVMRTSSVATIYHRDLAAVVEKSILFASVTHADPRSISGAVALSVAIALSIRGGLSVAEIMQYSFEIASIVLREEMQKNAAYYTPEELDALTLQYDQELYNYIATSTWGSLDLESGNGMGYAYKCMGAAFAALRRVEELGESVSPELRFRTVIQEIVEEGGDADTNAAAAGALLGAYLGEKAMPASWLNGLNDNSRGVLEENIRLVAQLSGAPPAPAPRTWVPKGVVSTLLPEPPGDLDQATNAGLQVGNGFYVAPPELDSRSDFPILNPLQFAILLEELPELKTMEAAQGAMSAFASIIKIHANGIPEKLDPMANEELKSMMQYVIFRIHSEPELAKRKQMLRELGTALKNCAALSHTGVSTISAKLRGQSLDFHTQFMLFISEYKDQAIEDSMYEQFPEMKDPEYAKEKNGEPSLQFPHFKNGIIAACGAEMGVKMKSAMRDPNRNQKLSKQTKATFLKAFQNNISAHLHDMIQGFVAEINRAGGDISNELFVKWWGDNFAGNYEIFYDPTREYPVCAGTPDEAQKEEDAYIKAFIDEATALKVFQTLGYVK